MGSQKLLTGVPIRVGRNGVAWRRADAEMGNPPRAARQP